MHSLATFGGSEQTSGEYNARFEILTAVLSKVFWDVTPCRSVKLPTFLTNVVPTFSGSSRRP